VAPFVIPGVVHGHRLLRRLRAAAALALLGPLGLRQDHDAAPDRRLHRTDGGEIRVGGRRVSSRRGSEAPERRNMSMIFQSYALWPHMTVAENVGYGLKLRGWRRPRRSCSAPTPSWPRASCRNSQRYPGELSGGQQQRVSLARALVVEPETLLLDEPLSNLDANLREEMRFEIRRLHDKYRYTTVYVTHDQAEAMTTADLIVVMNQGAIEQDAPHVIYTRPRTPIRCRIHWPHQPHRGQGFPMMKSGSTASP
jgi:iron(III) transport system ATP-binding protein